MASWTAKRCRRRTLQWLTGRWRAPSTAQEEILCALFAETLGIAGVGIEGNFFELGGDSISSIQLVAKARKAGLIISPRDVFEHQSVEALAAAASVQATDAAPGADSGGVGRLPLSPIMHWLLGRGGSIRRFSQSMLLEVPARLTEGAAGWGFTSPVGSP